MDCLPLVILADSASLTNFVNLSTAGTVIPESSRVFQFAATESPTLPFRLYYVCALRTQISPSLLSPAPLSSISPGITLATKLKLVGPSAQCKKKTQTVLHLAQRRFSYILSPSSTLQTVHFIPTPIAVSKAHLSILYHVRSLWQRKSAHRQPPIMDDCPYRLNVIYATRNLSKT